MPRISFLKKNKGNIEVPVGSQLMKALLGGGLPVASSCHGEAICGKCRIKIISGSENLSAETSDEKSLRARLHISDEYRISCQTKVHADIIVDADYW